MEYRNHRIRNIYYMLAYVYDKLLPKDVRWLEGETFDHLMDLFAVIMQHMVSKQVKRGLNKSYVPQVEFLAGLRGRIEVGQSIKQQTFIRGKLVCSYDEFMENTLFNQILKVTMLLLLRSSAHANHKHKLRSLMPYFNQVSEINPHRINWSALHYHRNNSSYQMLMSFCRLIIDEQLLSEREGDKKITNFLSEERMHTLYEQFVLAYYQYHHAYLNPQAMGINWHIAEDLAESFLPKMKTDITLSNDAYTLIIDTKFYAENMQQSRYTDKQTFISSHLYQIYAYVKNHDKENSGKVGGLLLYAETITGNTPNYVYNMGGNKIGVNVLNLGVEWQELTKQLDNIVIDFFD